MGRIYKGNLIITSSNAEEVKDITKVTGSVDISADAQLPVLESVGESVYISADAQLPVLESVGGSVYIRADAQLPVLKSVGESVDISADAQLPVLESVGGVLRITGGKKLEAPEFKGRFFYEIETDSGYSLCESQDEFYVAGCRGPWSKQEALNHWRNPRPDNQGRAALFVAAIEKSKEEA